MTPLVRAALVGAATGARTFTGLAAVALTSPSSARVQPEKSLGIPWVKGLITTLAVGELTADKLPQTPSRLQLPGLLPRLVLAAGTGATVAQRRPDGASVMPAAAGIALAAAGGGALLGMRWRALAADRFGADHLGAGIEDLYAVTLAWLAARG